MSRNTGRERSTENDDSGIDSALEYIIRSPLLSDADEQNPSQESNVSHQLVRLATFDSNEQHFDFDFSGEDDTLRKILYDKSLQVDKVEMGSNVKKRKLSEGDDDVKKKTSLEVDCLLHSENENIERYLSDDQRKPAAFKKDSGTENEHSGIPFEPNSSLINSDGLMEDALLDPSDSYKEGGTALLLDPDCFETKAEPPPESFAQVAQDRRKPSLDELNRCKTPRAKQALNSWYERLTELYQYKVAKGDCNVPQKYPENPPLGVWVNKQRMERTNLDEGKKSSLTETMIQALEDVGFTWAKRKGQTSWDARYEELQDYHTRHGNADVPTKFEPNPALGRWVSTQRSQYKLMIRNEVSKMTLDRVAKLEQLGFKWRMSDDQSLEH